jgi:tRNA threonylcarbamoyl adenosine modification protein YeaZ
MSRILCIETATEVCSVVLQVPGRAPVERRSDVRGVHSEALFRFIEELLASASLRIADLDAVAISAGPGSYTGLRIGASAVKGLLFGMETPVYAIDTLHAIRAMAQRTHPQARIHAMIDARRQHAYALSPGGASELIELSELAKKLRPGDVLAGTGAHRLPPESLEGVVRMGTESISALGVLDVIASGGSQSIRAVDLEPLYF